MRHIICKNTFKNFIKLILNNTDIFHKRFPCSHTVLAGGNKILLEVFDANKNLMEIKIIDYCTLRVISTIKIKNLEH